MQPVARLEAPGWPFWWSLNLAAYRGSSVRRIRTLEQGDHSSLKRGPSHGGGVRSRRPLWQRFQHPLIDRFGILHAWVRASPLESSALRGAAARLSHSKTEPVERRCAAGLSRRELDAEAARRERDRRKA